MIVSPNILRKEMLSLMSQIDELIIEIENEAESKGIKSAQLRDGYGNWVMIPLLAAKINAITTLTQLNQTTREASRREIKRRVDG